MAKPVIVVHGCCKGLRTQAVVEQESRDAASAGGVDEENVKAPYYACALGRAVANGGHSVVLPADCEGQVTLQLEQPTHDDSVWDQAIQELLEDPANSTRVARLQHLAASQGPLETLSGLLDPTTGPILPMGPWIKKKWIDVHVYLSGGHQPQGKDATRQAIEPVFSLVSPGEYVLIAHSLGSIVCADQIQKGRLPVPSGFVTVGSQLGWSALQVFFGLESFHLDGMWRNVIDRRDLSAGFFTRDSTPDDRGYTADDYDNVWVENLDEENPHDFVGYLGTTGAREAIASML